jgi:hypothetical protein
MIVSKSDKDRSVFYYIYHSAASRNDRGLEPRVLKDEESKIVSER